MHTLCPNATDILAREGLPPSEREQLHARPTLGLGGGRGRSLAARLVRHRELCVVASAAPCLAVSVPAQKWKW